MGIHHRQNYLDTFEICLHEDYFDLHKLTNIPQVLEYHEDVKKIDVILKFHSFVTTYKFYKHLYLTDMPVNTTHWL